MKHISYYSFGYSLICKSQQLTILVHSKRINLHLFLIIMNCCVTLKVFYVKQIKSLVTAIHFKKKSYSTPSQKLGIRSVIGLMKSILPMVDFVFLNPTKWIEIMVSHLSLLHRITVIHTFPMIMDIIKIIQVAHTMNKTKANLQKNKKKIRNQEINKK